MCCKEHSSHGSLRGFSDVPEFRALVGNEAAEELQSADGDPGRTSLALKKCFTRMMNCEKKLFVDQLNMLVKRISEEGERKPGRASTPSCAIMWFTLYRLYPINSDETRLTCSFVPEAAGKDTSRSNGDLLQRLHSQYPGDIGCFSIYFLNRIVLQPGEAMFLGANEPHAYLSGGQRSPHY